LADVTPAVPNISPNSYVDNSRAYLKPATTDLILDAGTYEQDLMINLTFEQIGGQELITLARTDAINGQEIAYQPIKNINAIAMQYNSKNLVPLSQSSNAIFKNFAIDLESKMANTDTPVYIDYATGDIVVLLDNIASDEQVEIQVVASGTTFDDTIY
jgi:hypothetical protein